jgi:hypothetical protein
MGYVTSYRDATRTVTSTDTGTRTAYRTAYETREQDIGFDRIPVIRPNFTYFSFSGLRPNTPHWIFFDGKNVTKWTNTSYNAADYNNLERNDPIRVPGEKYIDSTAFPTDLGGPTAASGPVYTDASGNLDGLFYIQSNSALSFPTGNRTLAVLDISVLDKAESLSFAQAEYSAIGEYELYYQYQHEYQEAYTETYSYTTSYTETYTESYETWVDDPVTTTTTTTTAPDDETPVVTTTATNSGSTTNTSSDDGGSTNMTLVYNPNDGYNYYMDETHADIHVEHNGWTDKGSGNDDAKNGSNNSDTVLCSLLHRRGYLSDDVWKHDAAFGNWVQNNEPEVLDGYHAWAIPMVDWIEKGSLLSKVWFYSWVLPFTSCWAKHIAHKMDPDNHKDNLVGRFMLTIGVPTCRFIGKMLKDKKVKA